MIIELHSEIEQRRGELCVQGELRVKYNAELKCYDVTYAVPEGGWYNSICVRLQDEVVAGESPSALAQHCIVEINEYYGTYEEEG